MGSVRVAIVGVGNCASSLVQGVHYYRDADESKAVPGLMHVRFGDYHVSDIEFVAAFDVDAKKVGFDLAEAIVVSENNTIKICDVPPLGVPVQRGTTLDGLGKYYREPVDESDEQPVDVVAALRESGADVLVCYLPVGSQQAAEFYAQAAIDAGVAFVNALPGLHRRHQGVGRQVHRRRRARSSATTSRARSAPPSPTASWPSSSRTAACSSTAPCSSTSAATWTSRTCSSASAWSPRRSPRPSPSPARSTATWAQGNVHIGPSDHVPWLSDRKWAYVRLEGRAFGDVPLSLEYKLEVWDSPNSAGIIIDAVRAAKIALDRGIGGPILSASSYFMKSPPVQYRRQPGPRRSSRPSSAATSSAEPRHPRTTTAQPPASRSGRGPVGVARSRELSRPAGPIRLGCLRCTACGPGHVRCSSPWGWRSRSCPRARRPTRRTAVPGDPVTAAEAQTLATPPAPQSRARRRRLRGHGPLQRRGRCSP